MKIYTRKFLETILRNYVIFNYCKVKEGKPEVINCLKPSEIKLAELMRMMDGPIALLPCVSLNYYAPCEECDEKSCKIKPVFEQVRDQTLSILGNTTIDLMRHKHLIAVKE